MSGFKDMRNSCIGYAVAALVFLLWFGVKNDDEGAVRAWGIGFWVMVSLAYGFHRAADS